MPEGIIPILTANSKYKRKKRIKERKQEKEKCGTEAKLFQTGRSGCQLLSVSGGSCWYPGGEKFHRLQLLPLQAGRLVGSWAVGKGMG